MTSERLLTRPSDAPKTIARRVPAPPRCQFSAFVISATLAATRPRRSASTAVAAPSSPVGLSSEPAPGLRVAPLVGGHRRHRRRHPGARCRRRALGVAPLVVALQGPHQVAHRPGAEEARDHQDEAHPRPGAAGRRDRHPGLAEAPLPDLGVAPLVGGDRAERLGAMGIAFDPGEAVVEVDRVPLHAERGRRLPQRRGIERMGLGITGRS